MTRPRVTKADLEHQLKELREGSYWEGHALGALARDEPPTFERILTEVVSGARIRVRAWGLQRADNGVVLVQQFEDSNDRRGSWSARSAYTWACDTSDSRGWAARAEGLGALHDELRTVGGQLRRACIEAASGPAIFTCAECGERTCEGHVTVVDLGTRKCVNRNTIPGASES